MKTLVLESALLISIFSFTVKAQELTDEIESSKPTNFYTLLDNTLENTSSQVRIYQAIEQK